MNLERDRHSLGPSRRQAMRWGCFASAAGLANSSGCTPPGQAVRASDNPVDVHVIRLERPDDGRRLGLWGPLKSMFSSGLAGRSVWIQSSWLVGGQADLADSFMATISSLANHLLEHGARKVTCSTGLAINTSSQSLTVLNHSEAMRRKKALYCSTRLSGRLRFEVPDLLADADVIVSAPLSLSAGPPLLTSTNLLGSIFGAPARRPSTDQLRGPLGDFTVDVACTIRPACSLNFLPVTGPRGGSFRVVTGSQTASVDAVTCRERGLEPEQCVPLGSLPSWLGPITSERISCHRHTA